MNKILLLGAVLGLLSIMIAAYVDHSLALHLTGKPLHGLLTAVRYHQLYAIVISMIGLTLPLQVNSRIKSWLARSAYVFTVGILLFSVSIYISAMTGITGITYLTPIGGIILMIGWGCLIRTALLRNK
jgi:uncharacterized membrane protein YgdD (TMEM256/DUF423 family)